MSGQLADPRRSIPRGTLAAWATTLAVYVLFAFWCAVIADRDTLLEDKLVMVDKALWGPIVLFGGLAKERPYPGSTTVTTVNGAISAMVRTLALALAPVRVNAIHPGVVGDSPAWSGKPAAVLDALVSRTPCGRLASMEDVAHAVLFLLDNQSVNGVNLDVDGGWLLT